MQIYLAPMEGITGYIVRNAFHHHFGCIDKYFTPFIPAAKRLNYKILRDLSPSNNEGIRLIPQLISNDAAETLEMINILKDHGFSEFNINLGCPSGTVTSKKRGSGLLLYPEMLNRFLDGLYKKADVPVSVKTRIGYESMEEWPELLDIYSGYPVSELIIHPRLRKEQYSGFPHLDAFERAYRVYADCSRTRTDTDACVTSLCYNGDIWTAENYELITGRFPDIKAVMLGRGLLARPDLGCVLKGIRLQDTRKRIISFCDEIYNGYLSIFDGEKDAVMHMKEIWANLGASFRDSERLVKKLMKCSSAAEYKAITSQIFETLELSAR